MSVTEKKNNGGFSLVELIVVIAISVVLIGAATISIRSVMGVEVKQCARNIESIINKTRVTTMGKDSAVLEIYKDASDGAYYYKTTINGTVSAPSKVGKSRIDVYYSMKDDYSDKTQLNSSDKIMLHDEAPGRQAVDAAPGQGHDGYHRLLRRGTLSRRHEVLAETARGDRPQVDRREDGRGDGLPEPRFVQVDGRCPYRCVDRGYH